MVPLCDFEPDLDHTCGKMIEPARENVFMIVVNGQVVNAWGLCPEHLGDWMQSRAYRLGRPGLPLDIAERFALMADGSSFDERIRETLVALIERGVLDPRRVKINARGPLSKGLRRLYSELVRNGTVARELSGHIPQQDELDIAV